MHGRVEGEHDAEQRQSAQHRRGWRESELKSDRTFQALITELEGTENRIATERRRFNEAVKEYNSRVQFIPGSIVASMRGYAPRPFFEAAPGAETAPKVKF